MTDNVSDEREELSAEVRAALTPEGVRAATRARLLSRASMDVRSRSLSAVAGVTGTAASTKPMLTVARGRGIATPLFSAMALALAASLVIVVKVTRDADTARTAFAAADHVASHRVDSLSALVAARDQLVASLTGAQVRVVGLSTKDVRSPHALMFWDKATDQWTFIAHNLAPLKVGRTYQLWLVTASKTISAGIFTVNPAGDAFVRATYPLDSGTLKAVAVTEETAGGVVQSTAAPVLVGAAGVQ